MHKYYIWLIPQKGGGFRVAKIFLHKGEKKIFFWKFGDFSANFFEKNFFQKDFSRHRVRWVAVVAFGVVQMAAKNVIDSVAKVMKNHSWWEGSEGLRSGRLALLPEYSGSFCQTADT